MLRSSSLGAARAETSTASPIRAEHLALLHEQAEEIRVQAADLADPYLGKLVERLLEDIEATSSQVHPGANAPSPQLATLRGAGHTLDRLGSALYLNLPVYLPELRASRRVEGEERLAARLRELAALCTYIGYHLDTVNT